MVVAKYNKLHDNELRNKDGDKYELSPGSYSGVFNILSFVDSSRSIAMNARFFEIAFAVIDSSGTVYRHLNVLSWQHLWPGGDTVVDLAEDHFGSVHARINNTFNTLGQLPIKCNSGEMLDFSRNCNDVELSMREDPEGIAVRLTALSVERSDSRENDYRSVDYTIPLDQLLWRRAPAYFDNDISVESADYVDFEKIVIPHLTKPQPIPGWVPSPIRKLD